MLKIHEIAHHRNGISGEPFHVVLFDDPKEGLEGMMAVLFEGEGHSTGNECITAVLKVDELAKGNIAFARGNSWRGDRYHDELWEAIKSREEN